MATCYRHPSRETGVSCSNCGRPICPDCMTPTSVGMRCPECGRQKTEVRTIRNMTGEPRVTYGLIAINVIMLLATAQLGAGGTSSNRLFNDLALFGPSISINHEYYRLVTSGFLHAGLFHIFFNMYLLYYLGTMLEPTLGSLRFALIYFTSLLAGSFGALLLDPTTVTVGASGAVFGLMGAAYFEMRARGIDPWQTGIGTLIVLNLGLSFVFKGISIGGHLGGLIGGAVAALALERVRTPKFVPVLACAVIAVGCAAAAVAVADSKADKVLTAAAGLFT
jgi:membrane associated rhomboid family serine protease